MIAKNVVIPGKGYVKVTLNKEETDKAMEELVQFNLKEMVRILQWAGSFPDLPKEEVVKLLFDKQGISAYTFLQAKLDDKIEELRKKG
jgi:hypothetical protein